MGTKRFLVTENEINKILSLYVEKNLIKEDLNAKKQKTYDDYWNWCSKNGSKLKGNDAKTKSEITTNIYSAIENKDEKTLQKSLEKIMYCGDLLDVRKEFRSSYLKEIFDTIKNIIILDNDWVQYVNRPLYQLRARTEEEIKRQEKEGKIQLSAGGGFMSEKGFYQTKNIQKVVTDDMNATFPTEIPLGTKIWIDRTKNTIRIGNTGLFTQCEIKREDKKLTLYYQDLTRTGKLQNKDFDNILQNTFCKNGQLKSWTELTGKQKPQVDTMNQNRQIRNVVSSRYKLDTDGTYGMYSKSPKIAEVQRCLGLTADGKMGPKTIAAVNAKLGKNSFTDADVTTLCSGTQKPVVQKPETQEPIAQKTETEKPFTPEEF